MSHCYSASVVTQNRPTRKPGTLTPMGALIGSFGMSNVLNEAKKQQVLALGKLGWPLRRIEQATGVRRETAGAYLKAAGIAVRPPAVASRFHLRLVTEIGRPVSASRSAIRSSRDSVVVGMPWPSGRTWLPIM